jgi:GNAT superfamily N-acetyltransferase
MSEPDLFSIPGFSARFLRSGDEALIFDLLQRCADFSLLVSGLPPTEEEARDLLTDLPPAKQLEDKFVIGLLDPRENRLIGLAVVIRGYPHPEDWFIGLLQLDPACRGQGLGRQFYLAIEAWAAQRRARNILLGVVEQNQAAHAFWHQLGFQDIEKRPPVKFGMLECAVFVMKRPIPGPPAE